MSSKMTDVERLVALRRFRKEGVKRLIGVKRSCGSQRILFYELSCVLGKCLCPREAEQRQQYGMDFLHPTNIYKNYQIILDGARIR